MQITKEQLELLNNKKWMRDMLATWRVKEVAEVVGVSTKVVRKYAIGTGWRKERVFRGLEGKEKETLHSAEVLEFYFHSMISVLNELLDRFDVGYKTRKRESYRKNLAEKKALAFKN